MSNDYPTNKNNETQQTQKPTTVKFQDGEAIEETNREYGK